MPVFIVLLRAIGPATHVKMSMKDLRDGCEAAGLEKVATYIQTGNLIVRTRKSAATVHRIVAGVLRGFDLANHVVLRKPEDLAALLAADPFPEAAAVRPSGLAVCFLDRAPSSDGLAKLERYQGPERFKLIGHDLCIDYVQGVTGSKLMPSVIERWLDTPATARNWNTVRKLVTMARAR
ncbi:Uncharacterized conserved protein, DUF1697 family [Rhizobiales bacterium GAS191]|jgi:uncharacterized protein (DUF1697 family)|nr:Uncharacterized conserved protein, DUF1697 family [Rhizobiales bacterium GAS113]SEE06479.1 Uncharacterized conserved protein, DUF1697 family [Rhizobiales bacterium GAS188]SEE48817.1 Uncharacterized conserved protein, DUF1697 family [Rhizobiales bacterium GAS191]